MLGLVFLCQKLNRGDFAEHLRVGQFSLIVKKEASRGRISKVQNERLVRVGPRMRSLGCQMMQATAHPEH